MEGDFGLFVEYEQYKSGQFDFEVIVFSLLFMN